MATNEEMSLVRQVIQLGMTITAQGQYKLNVEYHGHVDNISVFGFMDSGGYLKGWSSSDHDVYLGDFHQNSPFSRSKSKEGVKQLEKLLKDMDKLLKKDADGIPL
jgi:hypothetical protein